MSKHFTHLHLHSEYSLLDGAIKLERLVQYGKQEQLKALAITDHGNIFGAVKFFQLAKKAGIKPILGIEAYLTEDAAIKAADNKYHHLIILVQNERGYHNLCKLISFSFKEGFYFKPRIDYKTLERYSEGLIVTTACLGGHIPQLLIKGKNEEAHERIKWYKDIFGPNRFYFEVQPEDQQEQIILNNKLFTLGDQFNVKCVATGDCHYPTLADRKAHEVMLSIQTHHKLTDPDRFTFGECKPWVRTIDEMIEAFPKHQEAVWNAGYIADLCNFEFQTDKLYFPEFKIPQEHTQATFFKALCQEGLQKLLEREAFDKADLSKYQARLDEEVSLITNMGFIGYFLVVSDFIRWARANGIPVGPGRGSAAGSLVAWALEITNIDPIRYNLLFERFLNPERITMPDIDIDFCIEGRERVIQYVKDTYGHDNVCNIITFGTMMAKGVIKDVARVLGFPFEDANSLTDLIPDTLKITLKEAVEQEPKLKELIENNPKIAELYDLATRLEGLTRHASKHAAGIVISPQPISDVLPVYIPPKTSDLVTQYAMTELESLGFLKIDFLGLKNLTLIDRVIQLVNKTRGLSINIDKIPLDDELTFALISKGQTSGVFQLESDGLKDVLRRLQPTKFEDIIAVNALYRPGPLGSGMVDDYIERRHGRQQIEYLFPELAPILEETYGVIVYQEQVMKIASAIGSYSLGEADILRRAMGKKKAEVMAEQKAIFTERAIKGGFDQQKAGQLFDLMAYFAGYGFNKSHSAAYALIAYQTAYLKAHFAPEFMACLISLEVSDSDKMVFYLDEAKEMGIPLVPPDIHESNIDFRVKENTIIFGLQGIKSVGLASLHDIINQRDKKPFIDLLDLCVRLDLRTSNKRVLENLIYAGALDCLPGTRAQKIDELTIIIDKATEQKNRLKTGQMDLFGLTVQPGEQGQTHTFTSTAIWPEKEKLEKEKEVVGFYVSAHPLDSYQHILKRLRIFPFNSFLEIAQLAGENHEPPFIGCGLIKSHRIITTKKGDRMAFVQIEDKTTSAEIVVFPKLFNKIESLLSTNEPIIVQGTLDVASATTCKIKANALVHIDRWQTDFNNRFTLGLHVMRELNSSTVTTMKSFFKRGPIQVTLIYQENGKRIRIQMKQGIAISQDLFDKLEEIGIQPRINFL
jgi:DNA polymerase-3 subunit alpha